MIRLLVFAAFFAMLNTAAASQQENTLPVASHAPQVSTQKEHSSPTSDLGESPKGNTEQPQPPVKNNESSYTLWALVINSILTLITLAIAVAGVLQAKAAKDSAEIAMNSQRSWIVSTGIDTPDFTNSWIQRMTCHFKVFGNCPVRVTESNFRARLVPAKVVDERSDTREPDLPVAPDYKGPYTLEDSPEMGKIRAPEETFSVSPMLESMFLLKDSEGVGGGEDVKAIENRDKFLCAYGFVRYRDAFSRSKVRETRFCYVYHIPHGIDSKETLGFHVGGPPAYNEAT